MSKDIRKKVVLMIVLLLVILVGLGVSFAFFSTNVTNNGDIIIDVTASDMASVTYNNTSSVNLSRSQPGTVATSYFNVQVNSPAGSITGVYDIYWVVTNNTYIHDVTVGHENDKEITYSLYSSSDNSSWTPIVTNVDATTLSGNIRIAANELITASNNSTTTKYYKFELTLPNLPKDQGYNMGKQLSSYIEIRSSM